MVTFRSDSGRIMGRILVNFLKFLVGSERLQKHFRCRRVQKERPLPQVASIACRQIRGSAPYPTVSRFYLFLPLLEPYNVPHLGNYENYKIHSISKERQTWRHHEKQRGVFSRGLRVVADSLGQPNRARILPTGQEDSFPATPRLLLSDHDTLEHFLPEFWFSLLT